ncbi:MAG: TRAM domain-containing protein, partial [Thermoleophilaceae bacterium]
MEGAQATGTRPRKGDELELRIDRLAHGGAGVARSEGYVVFVRGAVPGDLVRARITRSKRSFGEADSIELIEPSPERVEPLAPHPGAPWQVLPYERQLAEKEEQVRDAL